MAIRTDSDNFDRANADPVSGNWLGMTGGDALQIVGNRIQAGVIGAGGSEARSSLPMPADQTSTVSVITFTGGGGQAKACVRMSSTQYSFYVTIIGGAAFGTATPVVSKFVNAAYTDLGFTSNATISSGSLIACDAQGTTIRALVDTVQTHTVTDSSLTSGYPGLGVFATSAVADVELDNWSATTTGYPVVINSASTTAGGTASATPAIALPASLRNDTVLVALFRCSAGGAIGWPANWNELADNSTDASLNQTAIAWKVCLGTEGATAALSCTSSKFSALVWQIYFANTTTPPELSTIATATSAAPNPTAVTPTGGSKDYLMLWLGGWEGEQTSPPASVPTNYNDPVGSDSGTGGAITTNVRVAGAWRHVTGTTEDPSAWTISVSDDWTAYTMAIYPQTAAVVTTSNLPLIGSTNINRLIAAGF